METNHTGGIPTPRPSSPDYFARAVTLANEAERLSAALHSSTMSADRAKRLNGRLGTCLKLSATYARLATIQAEEA